MYNFILFPNLNVSCYSYFLVIFIFLFQVPLFKSILGNNLIKNLDQIISPEVIMQLNYSGSRHKYGLANFHNINSVLQGTSIFMIKNLVTFTL